MKQSSLWNHIFNKLVKCKNEYDTTGKEIKVNQIFNESNNVDRKHIYMTSRKMQAYDINRRRYRSIVDETGKHPKGAHIHKGGHGHMLGQSKREKKGKGRFVQDRTPKRRSNKVGWSPSTTSGETVSKDHEKDWDSNTNSQNTAQQQLQKKEKQVEGFFANFKNFLSQKITDKKRNMTKSPNQ